MPPSEHDLRAISERIRSLLENGVNARPELFRYVDTMYGSDQCIDTLSGDDGDSNDCSLIDLIFSPDTAFQTQLEPFLENHRLKKEQIPAISGLLLRPPPVATVHFGSGRPTLRVQMPRWCAKSFIERLHIDFRLPGSIRRSIDERIPLAEQSGVKVMFRNFHPRLPEIKRSFILCFLNGADVNNAESKEDLAYLVSILDEFDDKADPLEGFTARKRFYHRHLQEALRLTGQLATSNVETLLSGGIRINPIHPEQAREKMRRIDRITWAAAGRVAWITGEETEITYETANLP